MDGDAALIVIDMLNPYDHEDADVLAENIEPIVPTLAALVAEAKDRDVDVVYVNDNYGDFAATRDDIVLRAMEGRPDLIEPIVPPPGAAFLQKVRHSAFYSTSLDHLLGEAALRMMERNMRVELVDAATSLAR